MSVAATSRPIVMRGSTLKRPVIRGATTLLRDGAGAVSMTSKSIWQAGRRTTIQCRASSEIEFDRETGAFNEGKWQFRVIGLLVEPAEPGTMTGGGFM